MTSPHRGRGSVMTSTPRLSKSMISAGTMTSTAAAEESLSLQPATAFFPFKLTATLAALKIVCGCVLVGLGAAAIIQKAGLAWKGAGIAGGVVVIISGVLGAYAVRTAAIRPYVVSFLLSCLCSLIASVTVIIYSATGLAKDANAPYGVKQDEDGNYVSDLRPPPSREAAMLINTVLIIVSFLDIIFSLPSVIITLRELCNCYDPSLLRHGPSKQDWRLMSWLGQHQPGLASPVWYSPASASVPYNKMPAPAPGSPYRHAHLHTRASPAYPAESSHPQPRPRTRSKSPAPRQLHAVGEPRPHRARQSPHRATQHQHQQHYHYPHLHPYPHYPSYPPLEMFYPQYPQHLVPLQVPHPVMHGQWVFGPADWPEQLYPEPPRQHRQHRDQSRSKRSRSKSQAKDTAKRKKPRKGPTDSDIEKTYTGMDRELAEEFIEQTMDPSAGGAGGGDQTVSGTESEAW